MKWLAYLENWITIGVIKLLKRDKWLKLKKEKLKWDMIQFLSKMLLTTSEITLICYRQFSGKWCGMLNRLKTCLIQPYLDIHWD